MASKALKAVGGTVEDELKELDKRKAKGVITIHGREYQTVAYRVQMFRERYPDWALTTAIICRDADCVVVQATIADETGRTLATGHAEERRNSSQINRTSALENAETSAIGRALAALGIGGTEFATANEVQNAIHQQANPTTGEDPPRKTKLDGPYDTVPKLEKAAREFVKTLRGFSTLAEFEEWKQDKEVLAFVDQCKRDLPGWWFANREDNPPDFIPLAVEVHQTRVGLQQIEELA